jgi:hypothetical protein
MFKDEEFKKELKVFETWRNNQQTESILKKYILPLSPILISVIPYYWASEDEMKRFDRMVYIKMAIGIVIPILIADFVGILPCVGRFFKRYFSRTVDAYVSGRIYDDHKLYKDTQSYIESEMTFYGTNTLYETVYRNNDKFIDELTNFPLLVANKEFKFIVQREFITGKGWTIRIYHKELKYIENFLNFIKDRKTEETYIYNFASSDSFKKIGDNKSIFSKAVISSDNYKKIKDKLDLFQDKENIKFLSSLGFNNNLFIMLYGRPGTAKTTLAYSIASEMKRRVALIDKKDPEKTLGGINSINFSKYVILFDDIDFWDMGDRITVVKEEKKTNFTLMKLMEILNGNILNDAVIVFTTNYIEKFDNALFRSGRIHLKLELTPMNTLELYEKFYKNIYNVDFRNYFTKEERKTLFKKEFTVSTVSEIAKNYKSVEDFSINLKVEMNKKE